MDKQKPKQKPTLIVNFFAGPGTGKSTTAAGVFSELKWRGIDCEIAAEYAKEQVWAENFGPLSCQPYVFGKQLYRLHRLRGNVDVVLTDSPLLLSLIYGEKEGVEFRRFVLSVYNRFNNLNFFLQRQKGYNPAIDRQILDLLENESIPHEKIVANREVMLTIANRIEDSMRKASWV